MKIDRLISIILTLLEKDSISATKLAEKFEVSTRTIYRDIETIEKAGVPITTAMGKNGGISILPQYKLNKTYFSTSQIKNLLIALDTLSPIIESTKLNELYTKLNSLKKDTFEDKLVEIHLDNWRTNNFEKKNYEKIKISLEEKKRVQFEYWDKNGRNSVRKVEGQKLVCKENTWYFYAYCTSRDDFRLFKLIGINNLKILEENYEPKEIGKIPLDGKGWVEERLIDVKLSLHISLFDKILNYTTRDKIEVIDDKLLVTMPFTRDDYGYNVLLSFGRKCTVLSPVEVKEELKEIIKDILNNY